MRDLQNAVDLISDRAARAEFENCIMLLKNYGLQKKIVVLAYQENLAKSSHDQNPTKKESGAAMAKAQAEHPKPDPQPVSDCETVRLPELAR